MKRLIALLLSLLLLCGCTGNARNTVQTDGATTAATTFEAEHIAAVATETTERICPESENTPLLIFTVMVKQL